MSPNAFAPMGLTTAISVTSTASTQQQVNQQVGTPQLNQNNYVLTNLGPNTCYVAIANGTSDSSNGAPSPALAAAVPVAGTPANGYPVLAGSKETITAPTDAWFSAVCASAQTATLLITQGEGV